MILEHKSGSKCGICAFTCRLTGSHYACQCRPLAVFTDHNNELTVAGTEFMLILSWQISWISSCKFINSMWVGVMVKTLSSCFTALPFRMCESLSVSEVSEKSSETTPLLMIIIIIIPKFSKAARAKHELMSMSAIPRPKGAVPNGFKSSNEHKVQLIPGLKTGHPCVTARQWKRCHYLWQIFGLFLQTAIKVQWLWRNPIYWRATKMTKVLNYFCWRLL